MQWSIDGNHLLTTFEPVARLWDVDAGQQIGDAFPNQDGVAMGAASGETLQLATAVDGAIQVWNLDVDSWADLACRVAGRNMTQAEWDQLGPSGEQFRATCPHFGSDPAAT